MIKTIYFAGGCFWGTEHMLQLVNGVKETKCGYINGHVKNPDYKLVCSGTTGHKEAVMVRFDDAVISLKKLTKLFFSSIDPTLIDRQGNDKGSQYQAGIFYTDEESKKEIEALCAQESKRHTAFHLIVEKMEDFFEAEDYHQQYLVKNPGGYCHVPLAVMQRAKNLSENMQIPQAQQRRISPDEAKKMKEENHSVMLLDVRTAEEYKEGHIRDAVNIPLDRLPTMLPIYMADRHEPIVVYCLGGGRAQMACDYLASEGFTQVFNLGGICDWPFEIEE